MQIIGKSHEAFQTVKEILKSSRESLYTATDDLQVLSLAVEANLEICTLLFSYEENYLPETKMLLDQLISKAKNVFQISKSTYEALALKENHVGIIATILMPQYSNEDFKSKDFLFVLDHLEIPGNVGTIYRTLDSCSCDGVIMVDQITKINNPKVTSSSRGCNLIIPTIVKTYSETQKYLLENEYTIFLGEPKLGLDYQSYSYNGKIAFVVGNERFGINPEWYNNPHQKVYIPMEGHQNSLNVSVAASILAYEAYMKRKTQK